MSFCVFRSSDWSSAFWLFPVTCCLLCLKYPVYNLASCKQYITVFRHHIPAVVVKLTLSRFSKNMFHLVVFQCNVEQLDCPASPGLERGGQRVWGLQVWLCWSHPTHQSILWRRQGERIKARAWSGYWVVSVQPQSPRCLPLLGAERRPPRACAGCTQGLTNMV